MSKPKPSLGPLANATIQAAVKDIRRTFYDEGNGLVLDFSIEKKLREAFSDGMKHTLNRCGGLLPAEKFRTLHAEAAEVRAWEDCADE